MPLSRVQSYVLSATGWSQQTLKSERWQRLVDRRREALGLPDMAAYARHLESNDDELTALIEDTLNGETWLFRNASLFDWLRRELGDLVAQNPSRRLRMLSAPCSTGEEAFSLAIVALEAGFPLTQIEVVGLDISPEAVARAKSAFLGINAFRAVTDAFRERYFIAEAEGWRLQPHIARVVRFRRANIADVDSWANLGRFDVIFCRNLLIYLAEVVGQRVADACGARLRPGGILALAPCEAAGRVPMGVEPLRVARCALFRRSEASSFSQATGPIPPWLQDPAPKAPPSVRAHARRRYAPRLEATSPFVRTSPRAAALEKVVRLSDEGKLEEAFAAWERLMDEARPTAQMLYVGALINDSIGQAAQAEQLLRKALYLEPDHDEAILYMAAMAEATERPEGAARLRARARRAIKRRSTKEGGHE